MLVNPDTLMSLLVTHLHVEMGAELGLANVPLAQSTEGGNT